MYQRCQQCPDKFQTMLTKIFVGLVFTIIISCGLRFPNGQKCFKRTKVLVSSSSTHKFTDDYFKLRQDGFFDYYKRPFGANKMAQYKGTYNLKSDSLFLQFCTDTIPENLVGVGLIDLKKNEIVLIKKDTIFNLHFSITSDKRVKEK
jgi:hypothetical protein